VDLGVRNEDPTERFSHLVPISESGSEVLVLYSAHDSDRNQNVTIQEFFLSDDKSEYQFLYLTQRANHPNLLTFNESFVFFANEQERICVWVSFCLFFLLSTSSYSY